MHITKMHGLGNSQILVEDMEEDLEDRIGLSYNEIAEALCHPGFGIGGDQTLIILPSKSADYQMRVFNKDGGEAEMCGNGIRCVARYLHDRGRVNEKPYIETKAGIKNLKISQKDEKTIVEVDMGRGKLLEENKEVGEFQGSYISVGNPHFVVFTDEASKEMALSKGSDLEDAEAFQPQKVNVEFSNPISEGEIEAYVWERGAGLTLACGTGACATAYAAKKKGMIGSEVKIRLLGGDLEVKIRDENHILMRGPADYIMEGEVHGPKEIFSNIKRIDRKKF